MEPMAALASKSPVLVLIDPPVKPRGPSVDYLPTVRVRHWPRKSGGLNGRVWVDPEETGASGVGHGLVENVKRRFDAEGIGMPYPYMELTGSIEVERIEHTDSRVE